MMKYSWRRGEGPLYLTRPGASPQGDSLPAHEPVMKNILNVIADILTLIALSIAAIGHVLNWYDFERWYRMQPPRPILVDKEGKDGKRQEFGQVRPPIPQDFVDRVMESQHWHAARSGAALGGLAF